jgi:hypothetical protein
MKTSFQKSSLGGGYGINRSVSAERVLSTTVPPYGRTTVRPGSGYSRSAIGQSGNKHYAGAKIIGSKK